MDCPDTFEMLEPMNGGVAYSLMLIQVKAQTSGVRILLARNLQLQLLSNAPLRHVSTHRQYFAWKFV